jgi:hypothetical protein
MSLSVSTNSSVTAATIALIVVGVVVAIVAIALIATRSKSGQRRRFVYLSFSAALMAKLNQSVGLVSVTVLPRFFQFHVHRKQSTFVRSRTLLRCNDIDVRLVFRSVLCFFYPHLGYPILAGGFFFFFFVLFFCFCFLFVLFFVNKSAVLSCAVLGLFCSSRVIFSFSSAPL